MVKIFALEKFKEFHIDPPRKFRVRNLKLWQVSQL
jgi:hypothetical protein